MKLAPWRRSPLAPSLAGGRLGPAALLALPLLGCAAGLGPLRNGGRSPPDLRFVTREELGIPEAPLPLEVVFTIHPRMRLAQGEMRWSSRAETEPGFDCPEAFRALTRDVLSRVFRNAVEAPAGSQDRIEDLRRNYSARAAGELPSLVPKALVLVDFRPPLHDRPDLNGQLCVRIYDISCLRYEELSLLNPRLLIFEDYAEVGVPERPSRLTGALLLAWQEVLQRLRASDRFQRYLAVGRRPLDSSDEKDGFLFGMVGRVRAARGPDPEAHRWIERELLFPPPLELQTSAGRAGAVAPASAARTAPPAPPPEAAAPKPPPAQPAAAREPVPIWSTPEAAPAQTAEGEEAARAGPPAGDRTAGEPFPADGNEDEGAPEEGEDW
jgi:hypothetical protein